jgi:hypothetical protein
MFTKHAVTIAHRFFLSLLLGMFAGKALAITPVEPSMAPEVSTSQETVSFAYGRHNFTAPRWYFTHEVDVENPENTLSPWQGVTIGLSRKTFQSIGELMAIAKERYPDHKITPSRGDMADFIITSQAGEAVAKISYDTVTFFSRQRDRQKLINRQREHAECLEEKRQREARYAEKKRRCKEGDIDKKDMLMKCLLPNYIEVPCLSGDITPLTLREDRKRLYEWIELSDDWVAIINLYKFSKKWKPSNRAELKNFLKKFMTPLEQ